MSRTVCNIIFDCFAAQRQYAKEQFVISLLYLLDRQLGVNMKKKTIKSNIAKHFRVLLRSEIMDEANKIKVDPVGGCANYIYVHCVIDLFAN